MQACIEVLPSECVQVVIDEMMGHAVRIAQDAHASRVLEKLIEYCSGNQTSQLVDELKKNAHALCRHPTGNFIFQHILKYGTDEQQRVIVESIIEQGAFSLAKDKIGNHVVACALASSETGIVRPLVDKLEPAVTKLSQHQFGSFVARELKRTVNMS